MICLTHSVGSARDRLSPVAFDTGAGAAFLNRRRWSRQAEVSGVEQAPDDGEEETAHAHTHARALRASGVFRRVL